MPKNRTIHFIKKQGEVYVSIPDLMRFLQEAKVTKGSRVANAVQDIIDRLAQWAEEA